MHIIVLVALLCCIVAFVVTVASAVPAPGTVRGFQKISSLGEGGFSGRVDANEYFGYSSTALGDLDGDDITDLAVGAYQDNDGLPDAGTQHKQMYKKQTNTCFLTTKIEIFCQIRLLMSNDCPIPLELVLFCPHELHTKLKTVHGDNGSVRCARWL